MKVKFEWTTREAYLLDKLERNTIGKLKEATTKVKTKLQNIMDKLMANKITPEQYDELWETIQDRLEDLYDNNPDSYDLEDYDFRLEGNEIFVDDIVMGYDHNYKADVILKLLVEEGVIKVKDKK
jgi:phosphoglycolate phosphatase-like HAD superfamily hydrolase|tara:strand:- start:44 stop:418 length:375 start_codon:yes stop_codon:yes gene_type:complete